MPEPEDFAVSLKSHEAPIAPGSVPDGTAVGSRFKLGEEIACGGMGAIYRVQDLSLDRELAIKVLLPRYAANPAAMRRFRFEAQITSQLQHPGIVPIHDFGTLPDGRPYLAMKLIRGKSLAELLRNRASAVGELPQYLKIVDQICQAVAYAHSQGVIHRDLKPLNVMVGAFGEVQVMDWGLAKRLSEGPTDQPDSKEDHVTADPNQTGIWHNTPELEKTVAGTVLGTPAYMPPEQARGEVDLLDKRSDVFGLGAILCEVLTGAPPFQGDPVAKRKMSARADLDDAFARIGSSGADVELIEIVKRCLAPNQGERYQDAGELAGALASFQEGMQEKFRQADLARVAAQASEIEAQGRARAERRARLWAIGLALASLILVTGGGAAVFRIYTQNEQKKADIYRQEEEKKSDLMRVEIEARTAATGLMDQAEAGLREGRAREVEVALGQAEKRLEEANQPELGKRHARLQKELTMFKSLDKISLHGGQSWVYPPAFQAYGMDIEHGDPKQLALEIQASPIRERLLDALDGWFKGWVRRNKPELNQALFNLLREIDGDPLRTSIREALWKGERERLRELLLNVDVKNWPPSFAVHVGDSALLSDEDAIRILKAAYLHNPRYFILPYAIGFRSWASKPPRFEEAIEYFRVAIAIAPDNADCYGLIAQCQEGLGDKAGAVETLRLGMARSSESSHLMYNLTMTLLNQDRVDEARTVCLNALERHPNSSNAHSAMGVVYYEEKRYVDAINAHKKGIELEQHDRINSFLGYYNLGRAYYKNGNLEAAKAAFDKSLSLNPTPEVRSHLGLMQVYLNDVSKAAALLKDLNPATTSIRSFIKENDIKDLDNLIVAFRKFTLDDPKPYQPHYILGELLSINGDAEGAIGEYRLTIEREPQFVLGQMSLGLALAAHGNLKEATDRFRTVTTIDPKHADAHYQLGLMLQKQNDSVGAASSFQAAIKLKPRVASYHQGLGTLLRNDGKTTEALDEFKKACQCDSNHLESHLLLGKMLLELKDYDGAITTLSRCNEISPKTLEIQLALGEAGLQKGEKTLAEAAYVKATLISPRSPAAQLGMGKIWLGKGNYDAASQCFRKVIQIDPKSVTGHYHLGLAQAARKEWGTAATSFQQALTLDPKNAESHIQLGLIRAASKEWEAAAASFQQGIALDPKNASAHAQLGFTNLELKDRKKGLAALRQATVINPRELDQRVSEWASQRKGGWVERGERLFKVGVPLQELADLPPDAAVWLAALPADTEVWVSANSEKWDDRSFTQLADSLDEFRNLHIEIGSYCRVTDEGFAAMARLPHLRGIRLGGVLNLKITDAGLRRLHGNTNLTQIVIGAQAFSDAAIEPLIKNGNCRIIELHYSGGTRALLPSILKNRGLDWLTFRGIPLTGDDLRTLCQLEKLRGLGLDGGPISNEDIGILAGLPSLASLELHACTKIDSGVFKHLAKIKNLHSLWLNELTISDAGFEDAAKLPLTHLGILEIPLNDAGLEKLKSMKSLVQLNLTGTRVTADGVKSLKAALPNLNVEWDGLTKPK